MRSKTVSGMIVYKDNLNIEYSICRIDQITFENEEFRYDFRPIYRVIDILPPEFDGIPGIDIELRKECYTRENIIPVFIAERVPPKNRVNLYEELAEVGLDHYDALEWLIRTDSQYFGDRLFVRPVSDDNENTYSIDGNFSTIPKQCSQLMSAIASGKDILMGGRTLSTSEMKLLADLLRTLNSNETGHVENPNPVGRRPKDVDPIDIERVCRDISKGRITLEEGTEELGISRATLYRRMKQYGISF